MTATAELRCAVLGDPIEHSLSPTLHRAAFADLGVPGSYEALRVPAGGLAAFVAAHADSLRGLSLTMPLKREALALTSVTDVGDEARITGAANTLLFAPGVVTADNTDVPGAVAAWRERVGEVVPETAVIWGGGATAASLLVALDRLGCRRISLLVRDPARAADTVAVARRLSDPPELTVGVLGETVDADVLVSTIPASAQEALVESVRRADAIFEVIYHPWPTPLVRWAAGRPLVGGLDLLIHQAVLQSQRFTELDPTPARTAGLLAAMRAAGEQELHRRAGGPDR